MRVALSTLMIAYDLAKTGKRARKEVVLFDKNLGRNLRRISLALKNKTYRIAPEQYRIFEIFEPKRRVIMALGFTHRVVAHFLCIFIRPEIEKHLTTANLANRNNKGTYFGVKMMRKTLRQMYEKHGHNFWILKLDISGFFYNIDREILRSALRKISSDPDEKWLTEIILASSPDVKNPKTGEKKIGKGLPIGNLTSQFWAIFYLNPLDHYIKRCLKIKHYWRYMDDMILIHHDKKYLQECWQKIEDFLPRELKLELNQKAQMFPAKMGVDMLGFHFYLDESGLVYAKLRTSFKKKTHKHLRRMQKLFHRAMREGDLEMARRIWLEARDSFTSRLGHAKHANAYFWTKKICEKYGYQKQGKSRSRHKAVKLFGWWDFELGI